MTKTVMAFGETLWDLLPSGAQLGGAPFNFAYRVNCLGDRGVMVSRLGTDELGRKAREQISALGVGTRFIQSDCEHPTGTVEVTLDAGQPDYYIVPGVAYDYIEADDALMTAAGECDCLCFGTLIQRSEVSRAGLHRVLAAAPGAVKLLDINLRKDCFTPETIRDSLEQADVLKLNDDEARKLDEMLSLDAGDVGDIAAALVAHFELDCCVVTLGADGAMAIRAEGEEAREAGFRVDVADTVGSGDAFTAAFLHRYLRGAPLSECCRHGNALGAMVAAQSGATVPVSPADLARFLR
jgi:fructokinase